MNPCPQCARTFHGLCSTVDTLRRELAEFRIEAARYRSTDIDRAPAPTSTTVRELRLELVEARQQISEVQARVGELERANVQLRHVADTERRRAEHAEDRLRSAFTLAAWGGVRRA